ncbi:MAG: alcohol dehydrogenase catalytic domain-containing protein [Desulfobacterales bacterium]|nr:alcohol dehydrogenase catalytic domain-containing protein [Desulfobacterales bacterium]
MQMKCIRVVEVGSFETGDAPIPVPGEDEVLIKVLVTGLCRTDLKLIRVGHRDLTLPRIPAEEVVGVVHETGANVDHLKIGEKVYVYPGVWCGECPACLAGAENLCREMKIMGFHRDGGFAQYVAAPAQSVIPTPPGLSPERAVFAEPLSCCLNALELGGISEGLGGARGGSGEGMHVGIWGAGPAGALLSRAAAAMGARPTNMEPDERRRRLIKGRATCPEENFDLCVVAVGAREAYGEALAKLNPRGRLVVFSGLPPGDDRFSVSFNQLHYLEQTVVGAYGCCFRHGVQALEMIADGRVAVEDMISHRMSLYDLEEALTLVENREGMKILLYP